MSRKTNKLTKENYKIVKELNQALKSSSLAYIIKYHHLNTKAEDSEYLYLKEIFTNEFVYFDKKKFEFIPAVKSENIDMDLSTGRVYKK